MNELCEILKASGGEATCMSPVSSHNGSGSKENQGRILISFIKQACDIKAAGSDLNVVCGKTDESREAAGIRDWIFLQPEMRKWF